MNPSDGARLPHINDLIRDYGSLDDDEATDEVIQDLMELDGLEREDLVPASLQVCRPAIKRQLLDVRRQENRTRERMIRQYVARTRSGPTGGHRTWVRGTQLLAAEQLRQFLGLKVKVDERDELLADTMTPAEWNDAAEYKYAQAESTRETGNLYRTVSGTLYALGATSIKEIIEREAVA